MDTNRDVVIVGGGVAGLTLVRARTIFTHPRPIPVDGLLRQLGADLADTPFDPFVVTDPTGETSVEGVWAAGNVATVQANVPKSIGAGSFAAGAVNADLITEEIAHALSAYRERQAVE